MMKGRGPMDVEGLVPKQGWRPSRLFLGVYVKSNEKDFDRSSK
jgi:hypothetical protein